MFTETITERPDVVIRRMILEPGEAMPWHTDPCRRFSVVIRGERLRIEFRDTAEVAEAVVHAGMADWDEPQARVHRAINAGLAPYEEVVMFFRSSANLDPQPVQP
jgi:hypothetical protein